MTDDDNDEANKAAAMYAAADTLAGEKGGRHRAGRKAKRKRRLPDVGWQPARRAAGGGHPSFVATKAERIYVSAMRGCGMSEEEIASIVGAARGRPALTVKTLQRAFQAELDSARSRLRAMTARNICDGLRRRETWATLLCARNFLGLDRQKSDFAFSVPDGRELKAVEVEFIKANPKPIVEDDAPPSPQPSKPVDYKQPRLPAPPERELTPLGWVERGKPSDWMR